MDLLLFFIQHLIDFSIASIPLVIVFFQLKILKLSPKIILVSLCLNLLMSIYFWIRIGDFSLAGYQIVPYISAFVCVLVSYVLEKQRKDNKKKDS